MEPIHIHTSTLIGNGVCSNLCLLLMYHLFTFHRRQGIILTLQTAKLSWARPGKMAPPDTREEKKMLINWVFSLICLFI